MSIIKRKAGSEDIVKSILEFDAVPTEGSPNLVESGAVAKFTDSVPEGTTPENPLVNESALAELEITMLTNIPCANNTLRFKFSKTDYDPTVAGIGSSGTWKKLNANFHNVWDWTKSGTTFANAFENAFSGSDNLVSVIAAGDTLSITNMSFLFRGCSSLTSVTLFDTSNVTDAGSMFRGCTSLTSVPLFNTYKVTNFNDAFNSCSSLTSIPLLDMSKATAVNGTFNNCSSLTSVPLFDTSSVTNMSFMFRGCTSLTSVPLFNTSKVTNIGSMLNGCTKVEGGSLALYQQASTQETPPSNYTDCFKNCGSDTETGAAELAQIPQSWGGTMPNP